MTQVTRKEYIESELAKWKENFEIGFQDEFDLKAMIDLQYQFMITPMEHIKTIGDIVHTKNQIMRNLNLKPKKKYTDEQKVEYLLAVEDTRQMKSLEELFSKMSNVEKVSIRPSASHIITDQFKVSIIVNKEYELRGRKADVVFKVEDGQHLL
jgi:hypothetical protein